MGAIDKAFYLEACRFADSKSERAAAKWWTAFMEVIVRHMFYEGEVYVPLLGRFYTKHIPQSTQFHKDPNGGGMVSYVLPEHELPKFAPSDNFINDVNMTGVTREFRKRRKRDLLTERDYLRELRANAICADEFGQKEKAEEAQARFKEKLARMVAKSKGTVEVEDEDE